MAIDNLYSIVNYTGDGTTKEFTVPFPYLYVNDVHLSVDDEEVSVYPVISHDNPPAGYGAHWYSSNTIRFVTAPASDVNITIQRTTNRAEPEVEFENSAILTEEDLNLIATQLIYIVQEAYDHFEISYEDVTTAIEEIRDDTIAAKDDAIAAKDDAIEAKEDAIAAKEDAEDAKDAAQGYAEDASGYADAAQDALDQARLTTVGKIDKVMKHGSFSFYIEDGEVVESDVEYIWDTSGEDPVMTIILPDYYTCGANDLMLFHQDLVNSGSQTKNAFASHFLESGELGISGGYQEIGTVGQKSNMITFNRTFGDNRYYYSYQIIGLNAASLVDDDTIKWDADNGISVDAEAVLGDVEDVIREDVEDILNYEYQKVDTKAWSATQDYAKGALVTGSNGNLYVAAKPSNAVNPTSDTTHTWLNISLMEKTQRQKPYITHFVHDEPTYTTKALNGAVCVGDYLYSAYVTTGNAKQYVQRIDIVSGYIDYLDSNQNSLAVVEHLDLGHANSMTSDGSYLYVSPGLDEDQKVYKLDMETLQTLESFDVSDTAGVIGGIAYNDRDGLFYATGTDHNIHIFNDSFEEVGTRAITYPFSLGYILQDLCFKDGELYAFAFNDSPYSATEYDTFLLKVDEFGNFSQVWLLDLYGEVENLCVRGRDFVVGVNTDYDVRYDFYLVSTDPDAIKPIANITQTDKSVDDFGTGLREALSIYCKKRAKRLGSEYKKVDIGKGDVEFNYLEDAIAYAKRVDRSNYYTAFTFILDGDFSDRSYDIAGMKTTMTFSVVSPATAKLGPVKFTDCKLVNFWNTGVSIERNDTNKGLNKYGLFVADSHVYCGIDVTNAASDKTGTSGLYLSRNAVAYVPQSFTLTNFGTGITFYNGSLIQDETSLITFTNCTAKIDGERKGYIKTDSTLCTDVLASTQANIHTVFGNLATNNFTHRNTDGGVIKDFVIYRRGGGSDYRGICLATKSGSTEGPHIILRDYDSPQDTGSFYVTAKKSGSSCILLGTPSGSLSWGGQPVQTSSDERIKTSIANVPDAVLDAWGAVDWRQFKYNQAVQEKGEDNCRWHTGLVAQHVQRVFEEQGQDALAYGILCHEEWKDEYDSKKVIDVEARYDESGNEIAPEQSHVETTLVREAGDLWTVRYTEALCMEAAYQRRRADRAEARLAALEQRMEEMGQVIAVLGTNSNMIDE